MKFAKIVANKTAFVVSGVLVAAASFGAAAATGAFSSTPAADSMESSSVSIISSESEDNNMSADLDAIQQATDEGVSQIQEAASQAVQQVQQAADTVASSAPQATESSSTDSTSSASNAIMVNIAKSQRITYQIEAALAKQVEISGQSVSSQPVQYQDNVLMLGHGEINEDTKTVILTYSGSTGGKLNGEYFDDNAFDNSDNLKLLGFTLKDANGNAINYTPAGSLKFQFTYSDLSSVSNMTFNYKDQSISITTS